MLCFRVPPRVDDACPRDIRPGRGGWLPRVIVESVKMEMEMVIRRPTTGRKAGDIAALAETA
ncbi:hypothetical protein GCM10007874_15010 [Labrys miyagiensis]|uniref:Uncharacterized protein n=1 Tax=Labrys miyagiensis TaxID=346912 RepID=A0ABQ6CFB4_9HYPH|nr:hypothetical protein GCM10007874_15010 [Labrys miyagiensis]